MLAGPIHQALTKALGDVELLSLCRVHHERLTINLLAGHLDSKEIGIMETKMETIGIIEVI